MIRSHGQSNESAIISHLIGGASRTFVEFGFHPIEFNCAALVRDPSWKGLLIDSNPDQVRDAKQLFPARIDILQRFVTLDNLEFIRSHFPKIGVLSIDVDGNDYWFLKALLETRPAVICVEYNSTFGFEPITVPYDPHFDRHQKHRTGWYHGASLTALAKLCAERGYGLAAVSEGGGNAFFTESGHLNPHNAWRPNVLRKQYSGVNHAEQWDQIAGMPFVGV